MHFFLPHTDYYRSGNKSILSCELENCLQNRDPISGLFSNETSPKFFSTSISTLFSQQQQEKEEKKEGKEKEGKNGEEEDGKKLLNFFCSGFVARHQQRSGGKVKEELSRFLAYLRHLAFNLKLKNFQFFHNEDPVKCLIEVLSFVHVYADPELDFHLYLEARWTVHSAMLYLAR